MIILTVYILDKLLLVTYVLDIYRYFSYTKKGKFFPRPYLNYSLFEYDNTLRLLTICCPSGGPLSKSRKSSLLHRSVHLKFS